MGRILVFNHISLDGYFVDAHGEMGFARNEKPDAEWDAFVAGNASGGGMLLFGRITYDLMVSFWHTPMATQSMPVVAERMNNLSKVVFSRTMEKASWNNTKVYKADLLGQVRKMKNGTAENIVIFGSGSIISQLAPEGLIDEYQIILDPVVLGKGRTMFEGIKDKLPLKLLSSRTFNNGNMLLCYEPMS